MAIDYATLDELKDALSIDATDLRRDEALNRALSSASRDIDAYCNRYFGQMGSGGSPESRIFETHCRGTVVIDDNLGWTTIEYEAGPDTWAAYTDPVVFLPRNAGAEMQLPKPYTMIRTYSGQAFPHVIRINGQWGWPAVPSQVHDATILQAVRLFKSKDVPLGVVGGADMMGTMRLSVGLHPDAQHLVQPFQRAGIG